MSSGQVGGAYAALMGKKNKSAKQTETKPKAAKVISLKDTKDSKPVAKPVKEEKPKAAPKAKEPEKEVTKREAKDTRARSDRHAPRSGHAPSAGKKTDEVKDAATLAKDAARDAEREERNAEYAARDAERAAAAEEEAKKVIYSDYLKQQAEKKAELGIKDKVVRKVDDSKFAKFKTVTKDEDNISFKTKKADAAAPKHAKVIEQEHKKKAKFTKSVDVGFFVAKDKKPSADRPERPARREPRAAPAPKAAPAAVEAEAEAAKEE